MTALDILHGRGGGRRLDPGVVITEPAPVLAVCPHGDRWWITPADAGKPCWRDNKPLAVVKDTP